MMAEIEDHEPKERPFVRLIKDVCAPYDIEVSPFTREWNLRLKKGSTQKFVYYYEFDINSSASSKLCKHKPSAADALGLAKIPHVPHILFLSPKLAGYASESGTFPEMHKCAGEFKYNVVVKTPEGSGGDQVYHCRSGRELEARASEILLKAGEVSLSPFREITDEYRVIILNQKPQLLYRKVLPQIVGDGTSSIKELLEKFLAVNKPSEDTVQSFNATLFKSEDILPEGQVKMLTWKHNLQQGATVDLDVSDDLKKELEALAIKTATALNIVFASVDIITTAGKLEVMEVNSGIMMKCFMKQLGDKGVNIAKGIYARAICSMFDLQPIAEHQ